MIVELGHYALVLTFALTLIQSTVPLWGAVREDDRLMAIAPPVSIAMFFLVLISFAALTIAYVTSDFSVVNVWENSHSAKPMLFKITGVWGNHEGSLLLWVLILVFFGALVAYFGSNMPSPLRAATLAVQGWVTAGFVLFMLATSNPFNRIPSAPIEGNDLNPILQDIGLAIHPPLLYVGYVGFSITFSFAVAALILGRIDAAWARWVRPWTLLAWAFLTLGIAMGSYWAYYELGWGGWWFWDPVENASFMPWLAGTALLHSAIVMEKRDALKVWTVLLAIFTFSLSLLGTFLVRSGVLTSVHAFATDPARGVFILVLLCLFIGGSLSLYAWRAPLLKQGGLFSPISREGALVLNNLFLSAATAAVLVGTLYPLALDAITGEKISVGEPFFNLTFGPLMVPLLMAIPFGPVLAWKRGDLLAAAERLYAGFGIAILAVLFTFWLWGMERVLAPIGVGLGVWVMAGAICEIWTRVKPREVGLKRAFERLKGLPGAAWGTATAHFGVGVTVLGIVTASAFQDEYVQTMKPGDTVNLSGYAVTFDGVAPRRGANFIEDVGHFTVRQSGVVIAEMEPSKRLYTARQFPTTEAGIHTVGFSQIYLSMGEGRPNGAIDVRVYFKPLVTLIWIGCVIMAIGAVFSMADRRLRVGAPKPSAKRSPQPSATPAE
ncbi:cytochrome c-type biogenesis protein CcmF [Roseibium hamelinense]|uniref:Cytochrome c-type biogenesis protein CcmF n=1 Tax=Roseibium hamelinense TaxID=150831 RepID=A0A562T7E8_9HYPH|nr:heme lyase CcmF/NrfE family subunit [Roseibium hamelinense]MTI43719.1 heme lyase CcmF/NrfE family subunit [Roseibium hamelinense]TWI89402.1 cytochrome c-type biogenesis protein CcmF [Roseibium hamelinense]